MAVNLLPNLYLSQSQQIIVKTFVLLYPIFPYVYYGVSSLSWSSDPTWGYRPHTALSSRLQNREHLR